MQHGSVTVGSTVQTRVWVLLKERAGAEFQYTVTVEGHIVEQAIEGAFTGNS